MQHVKEGNLSEMSVLFERYNIRLYNFFIKMGVEKNMSCDLVQNLFYRMIKYRHAFKNEYSFKSWIYQMARNIHNDYRNQLKRSGNLFISDETIPVDIINEEESYNEEDYDRLEMALSELGNEQREIIVLSRFEGLKYEEISKITGQSVPAIKVMIHRAIRQLRGIYFRQV